MIEDPNVKELLTDENIMSGAFADAESSGSIDLGHIPIDQEGIYQMAEKTNIVAVDVPKSKSQIYYEEVEELKGTGVSNADAMRQVAEKHGATENAVRGGIYQYRSKHTNGATSSTTPRRSRSTAPAPASVDDYLASARSALESARDLINREVDEAKSALDAAQARYDEVQAAVQDRRADIEKKLAALS